MGMTVQELLNRCRGEMSKTEFAELTGLSRRMVDAMYSGERLPGRLTLLRLAKHYPDQVASFFALKLHSSSQDSPAEQEGAA